MCHKHGLKRDQLEQETISFLLYFNLYELLLKYIRRACMG